MHRLTILTLAKLQAIGALVTGLLVTGLLVTGLLVTGSSCNAQATSSTTIDPAGVRGACLLGGGGSLPDSVYERFLELAGGKTARILIVPTASARANDEAGRTATLARWQAAHPGY